MELASAPIHSPFSHQVVTPAAAQIATSVGPVASLVTQPTGSTDDVDLGIPLAESGRFLIVVELLAQVLLCKIFIKKVFLLSAAGNVVALFPQLVPLPLLDLLTPSDGSPDDLVRRRHVAQIALHHQHGALEAVLQRLADYPEIRRGLPTGLELARAGHAVTLAAYLHVVRQYLQSRRFIVIYRERVDEVSGSKANKARDTRVKSSFRCSRNPIMPIVVYSL